VLLLFLLPCLIDDELIQPDDPATLARIANDMFERPTTRGACVRKLVRNHVHAGMTLFDLSALLNQPTWLLNRDVTNWNHVCGSFWIPCDIRPEDTTYCINIELGEGGNIWLRVAGKVETPDFMKIVRGIRQGENPVIREIRVD
jgi:hypothetical protein